MDLIVLLIIILGILITVCIVAVVCFFYKTEWKNKVMNICISDKVSAPYSHGLKWVKEAYSDFLEKRNDLWFSFGQIVIAAFIVTVVVVLMLTKTIEAQAGLPLLSAISGFAIAKSANTIRNKSESSDD